MPFLNDLFILQSIDSTGSGFKAQVLCRPGHPVYQAHFPGHPVTPGVCLLQVATEIAQRQVSKPLHLKAARNIKFLNVLIPEEGKMVRFDFARFVSTDTECQTQVIVSDETTVYTKMSLIFSHVPL